ncbi:hypothetical protein [Arthrobacter sp. NPDC092385]|uniref:hypothetical protein n=1 Tax=Arthrobacter sp. NPDC092385 TaxID=3363943 RepID=UPI00380D9448
MTTLTDRYVWAALRTVPESQRCDVDREVRHRIEQDIRARVDSGDQEASAESAALMELGDPERIAAAYTGRQLTLIGPRYYLDWLRLLKTVTAIAVPVVAAVVLVTGLLATGDVGGAIGSALSTAIQVALQIAFWITLLFVVLERSSAAGTWPSWSPEHLPQVPGRSRHARLAEFVASLVFLALFAGVIIWQQVSSVVRDAGGNPIPLLEPALWSFWIPWFLGLIIAECVFAGWLYARGWSWAAAIVNLCLNIAFTAPAVLLLSEGRLLNGAFFEAVGLGSDVAGGEGWMVGVIAPLVLIAAWDVVDGFLKAWRAIGPGPADQGGPGPSLAGRTPGYGAS